MMNTVGSPYPLALSVFAVLLMTGAAPQSQAANAPTDSDCQSAWESSSASDSCGKDTSKQYRTGYAASVDTSSFHVVAQDNECYVEVNCLRYTDTIPTRHQTFSGSTDEVEALLNCDGRLKKSC